MSKRLFDLVMAATALLVLSPLLLGIALVVRLDSPGPALFRQQRVGRFLRPFTLLKFRSMRVDHPGQGPGITAAGDRRVTRVGAWLRRGKLDELPQLWNVVRGDMSLVGSRPEVPAFVALFEEDFRVVLQARPGLTDPASIAFRDEEQILGTASDPIQAYITDVLPKKLALSKAYVAEATLWTDLWMLWRTVSVVLAPQATDPPAGV